jgi:predicted O-methyltransferase YrrM
VIRDEVKYPNWFVQYAEGYFERHLSQYTGQPGVRFLQIGAYTGDATTWLLDHILTGADATLTDVDTWGGSDEEGHQEMDFGEVEQIYDARTGASLAARRLIKFKGTSKAFFDTYPDERFDFVYIDGDHTAFGVLNDAVRCYSLLRVGGILAFDDYQWQSGKGRLFDPAPAIDAIADLYSNRLEKLEGGLQVWFRKTGSPEDAAFEERPAAPPEEPPMWRRRLIGAFRAGGRA